MVPDITVTAPTGDIIATETALYNLTLTNIADTAESGDYELYTKLEYNQDGLRLSINGMPFTDVMRYTAFPYFTPHHVRPLGQAMTVVFMYMNVVWAIFLWINDP